MSKRVGNNKRSDGCARYGRIRIGWRTKRSLGNYRALAEVSSLGNMAEASQEAFKAVGAKLRKILPRRLRSIVRDR